jgi:nucleoside-diphosphate-sugar epimerase
MKVLFIGGTGVISTACVHLAIEHGFEVYVLNRGQRAAITPPVKTIIADVKGDRNALLSALGDHHFDAVADFIAFTPEDIERNCAVFAGRTRQFVFVSSASCYEKPPSCPFITEDTPLKNPHWDYSRLKIACEERLLHAWRNENFPVTIVRPSLTFNETVIPLVLGSWGHPYTLVDRMKRGLPVVVPGDGSSLWTITWSGDFAKGFVGLLGRETTLGHAFHITSDEVLTWNQIFTEVAHAVGAKPKLVHIASKSIVARYPDWEGTLLGDKVHSVVFDNSKIKRFVPEFVATVPWSEGVRRSLAHLEAHPERKTIDTTVSERHDALCREFG